MDAREIESLSMISRGFSELKDVNPDLAYNLIVDILAGVNEFVLSITGFRVFHFLIRGVRLGIRR
jgi:hypothetical protein